MRWPPSCTAMGGSEAMQAASYLVYACQHLNKPQEVIAKAFGENFAALAVETTKLVRVQQQARVRPTRRPRRRTRGAQTENVRKMLLAFSRDLRVVMLRLASRLQTLRYYGGQQAAGARERGARVAAGVRAAGQPPGHLAGQVGDGGPGLPLPRARDLQARSRACSTRSASSAKATSSSCARGSKRDLRGAGHRGQVQGRPKHIYSIVKKMRGKSLDFEQVFDIRALRVIVPDVKDCYAALAWVHAHFQPIDEEFDDYIARPKPNGYQSLHTVVRDATAGRQADRDPDPHAGDARPRRARRGRALGLQGGRRQGLCGRLRPAASTTPRSPCCASCWPGSATCRAASAARACSTTASTC